MSNPFDHDPPSSTRERVALLELRLDYCARSVEETRRIVQDLDEKFDEFLLQCARDRKASLPPKKSTALLTKGAQQTIGGTVGAGLLYLLQSLFQPAQPVDVRTPVQTAAEHSAQSAPK
jgi:hypothetical protein